MCSFNKAVLIKKILKNHFGKPLEVVIQDTFGDPFLQQSQSLVMDVVWWLEMVLMFTIRGPLDPNISKI